MFTAEVYVAPRIDLVPEGSPRPRWSVMIPTYNCAGFLRQTLESVLAQDPGSSQMQIEVIDDCSTKDDPEAVVQEIGRGRVEFYRQPRNVGAVANFNTCIRRSRGHLIHILHGDDYVGYGFYRVVDQRFSISHNINVVVVRTFTTDCAGEVETLLPRLVYGPGQHYTWSGFFNSHCMPFAGMVIRRTVYETLGGFREDLVHVNDWEMWDRAITKYGFEYVNSPLAYYRVFDTNDTGRLARSGENLHDYLRLIPLFQARHSNFDEPLFRKMIARNAYNQYMKFIDMGDIDAADANLAIWRTLVPTHTVTNFRIKQHVRNLRQFLLRSVLKSSSTTT